MKKYVYVRRTTTYQGRRYEVRGKTAEEAAEKLAALKEKLNRGEFFSGGNVTVNQWFRKWLTTYKKPAGLTPKSLHLYEEKYGKYLRPVIGKRTLLEIRDFHLQALLNEQEGMSYSHVTKLRMVMQEMFRQAYRSRLIPFDPAEGLHLPRCVRHSRRPITEEERTCILAVAKDHPAGLLVRLLLYAGLRPGEAAALLWSDVDFDRNELHINKALESGCNDIKAPKTSAGVRDIPLHRSLRQALWAVRGEPEAPVLCNRMGNRHNHSSLYRLWGSFAKALADCMETEYSDLTPYCLRHTFCTDLQRAGVPLNVAKELMGHADITVTANIYTHRDSQLLHQNILQLEKMLP